MIAKTTEDFVKEQVWPVLEEIENHNFDHTVRLLKQAGELGLLGADVPEEYGGLGLDKITSTLITEKISLGRSFGLSHGAHVGIGTPADRLLRQRGAEAKIPARSGHRRENRRLRPDGARFRFRRPGRPRPRRS